MKHIATDPNQYLVQYLKAGKPLEYDMILGYQRYRAWKLYVGFEFDLMFPSLYYTREGKLVLDP